MVAVVAAAALLSKENPVVSCVGHYLIPYNPVKEHKNFNLTQSSQSCWQYGVRVVPALLWPSLAYAVLLCVYVFTHGSLSHAILGNVFSTPHGMPLSFFLCNQIFLSRPSMEAFSITSALKID